MCSKYFHPEKVNRKMTLGPSQLKAPCLATASEKRGLCCRRPPPPRPPDKSKSVKSNEAAVVHSYCFRTASQRSQSHAWTLGGQPELGGGLLRTFVRALLGSWTMNAAVQLATCFQEI